MAGFWQIMALGIPNRLETGSEPNWWNVRNGVSISEPRPTASPPVFHFAGWQGIEKILRHLENYCGNSIRKRSKGRKGSKRSECFVSHEAILWLNGLKDHSCRSNCFLAAENWRSASSWHEGRRLSAVNNEDFSICFKEFQCFFLAFVCVCFSSKEN